MRRPSPRPPCLWTSTLRRRPYWSEYQTISTVYIIYTYILYQLHCTIYMGYSVLIYCTAMWCTVLITVLLYMYILRAIQYSTAVIIYSPYNTTPTTTIATSPNPTKSPDLPLRLSSSTKTSMHKCV